MNDSRTLSTAALLLRLFLGAVWLAHACLTLAAFLAPGIAVFLAEQGMPTPLTWPAGLLELAGGLLLLFGFHGRAASFAMLALLADALPGPAGNGYALFLAAVSVIHLLVGDGAGALPAKPVARRDAAPVRA
ncbi:DoxX family membrane protein [Massilia sp. AB1]|uniref:DoxX family membrane protein n=1 Tax=Massilia sp. AB1 TaxID=2823371 RepID=UPI001B843081|nr:DoxX family membrane protein [Massilia sp. AB1]MBQ5941321.1 DoxX family membrane protein [Massilia sp. AB1]